MPKEKKKSPTEELLEPVWSNTACPRARVPPWNEQANTQERELAAFYMNIERNEYE
jgi:hypothetical protein